MVLEIAPDEGWAWVIAFAACFINMIMSGLSRTVAMLYVEVINSYEVSRQDATIPFTVRNAIRCISGPLVGIAGQRFAIRNITFWGGVLSVIGGSLCAIAPNIFWLTIFWGIINGFGFAFGNTLFLVVVSQYFDKHKTTACGIALSGGCLGCLILPFILEAITSHFDISGTFLILGGIIMQVLPPAIILNSPPWLSRRKGKVKKQKNGVGEANDVASYKPFRSMSFRANIADTAPIINIKGIPFINEVPQNNINDHYENDSKSNVVVESATRTQEEQNGKQMCSIETNCQQLDCSELEAIFESKPHKVETEITQLKGKPRNVLVVHCMDFISIYSHPMYILLSLCFAAYAIILTLVSTIIVDYGKDKGIGELNGKYLIISVAIGDLVGRLCFGWVTDKKFLSAQKFLSLMFIAQAAVAALFPLARSFVTFVILLTSYGIVSGCALVVTPALIVKYASVMQQPIAMSCVNFLAGFVSFGIPPFIGYFRDDVGSYDGLFLISGGLSVICGSMWFLEPALMKLRKSKAEKSAVVAITNGY